MKQKILGLILLSAIGSANAAELIKLTQKQEMPLPSGLQRSNSPELREIKKFKQHARFQQLIDGIPVFGQQVIYHNNSNNSYYTGHWIKLSPAEKNSLISNTLTLTSNEALNIAKLNFETTKNLKDNNIYHYRNEQAKLHYYLNDAKQLKKIYLVTFFANNEQGNHPARPFYLLDANSKRIIKHWDGLTTHQIGTGPGGNEKIGRYEYGVDYQKLDVSVKEDGVTCKMANKNVETINLDHTESNNNVYEYRCPDHPNDDEINGAYSPLNDAHFFGGVIFDMYQNWYNITPLSFKLKMQVHYSTNFENAFWDGSSMTFGDGAEYFYPLISLDVAAHEVSHGVTEQNSGLEYWGQSGGLNEAFSDMAGKTAEYYLRGENKWELGSDITKGSRPLRYMDKPERDGNSIGDARDFEPGLDVHFTSGVFNRLFYTLATTNGWNTRKAFEVMLIANMHYWEPESNYYQAAEGILHATKDLNYKIEDILNAAKTVGISCVELNNDYQCQQSAEDKIRV